MNCLHTRFIVFSLVITVRISDIFRWNVSVLVAVFLFADSAQNFESVVANILAKLTVRLSCCRFAVVVTGESLCQTLGCRTTLCSTIFWRQRRQNRNWPRRALQTRKCQTLSRARRSLTRSERLLRQKTTWMTRKSDGELYFQRSCFDPCSTAGASKTVTLPQPRASARSRR